MRTIEKPGRIGMGVISTVVVCLLFWTSLSFTQTQVIKGLDSKSISTSYIDSIILQRMITARVTGLNLAILNDNKIAYIKSYGFNNMETGKVLDTSAIMYAASFSKAVFAYLSLLLVQDGTLVLDRPLWQYLDKPLPEYPNYSDLKGDDRWKQITARMCLSHTSGFPNWRFLDAKTGSYIRKGKLAIYFTPGSRYAYSGEGFALLQMVIEKITGMGLEELARKRVFEPIGMGRTSFVWQTRFEENHASGHDENEKPLPERRWTEAGGAGSMETTIADFAKFIQYIMMKKGLNKETMEMALTPQIQINSRYQFPTITDDTTKENQSIHLSYGLGWGLLTCRYGRAFFKEGHDDGWEHYNINFVDKGVSVIIMTNSSNGESIFKELLEKTIGDIYTPWKWERYIPSNFK